MPQRSELGGRIEAALGDSYEVQRELASGGMATVFLAREKKADRLVALKVLHPEMAKSVGAQRFRHEVEVASRLEHPNILRVLDHGEAGGDLLWYSMPYVSGETLRERLAREPQLPLADALRIARDVAGALEYAHNAGYMHRDVKPDNILVTETQETLLADFGIARAVRNADGSTRAAVTDVEVATTTTGFVIGSPQYMSPEQVGGDPSLDGRTDQYSLGTVLYEMLAGETPFGGRNAQAVVAKMFASGAPSVRVTRPDVPVIVDDAIKRALSRSRGDRFATISEFASKLQIASSDARAGVGGALTKIASRLRSWSVRE
ncbi:MAG: protein kinase [Gemmatimonadetes bacterium]|nr:protein kinase [Gemmatimonadota bacterium]